MSTGKDRAWRAKRSSSRRLNGSGCRFARGADQLIELRILGEFDESQRIASRLGDYPIRDLTIAAKP